MNFCYRSLTQAISNFPLVINNAGLWVNDIFETAANLDILNICKKKNNCLFKNSWNITLNWTKILNKLGVSVEIYAVKIILLYEKYVKPQPFNFIICTHDIVISKNL